jgi:hypothetical protein
MPPLKAAFRELLEEADAELKAFEAVHRGVMYRYDAWCLIKKVVAECGEDKAMFELLMMGVIYHQDPDNFRDHRAFVFAVANRFIKLATSSFMTYADVNSFKRKRVQVWHTPRFKEYLGQFLIDRFVGYGLTIALEWTRQATKADTTRRAVYAAIKGVNGGDNQTASRGDIRKEVSSLSPPEEPRQDTTSLPFPVLA